ncbi:Uncharacterised protein [Vibrio cholerae]|nr:Uncharacterised protein [Vibrio cholerae]CSA77371.1 Uncharacterised protein [Vibrio cholerae]CSC54956.1 Uncharacterised protein [Vibrio cholerae]
MQIRRDRLGAGDKSVEIHIAMRAIIGGIHQTRFRGEMHLQHHGMVGQMPH